MIPLFKQLTVLSLALRDQWLKRTAAGIATDFEAKYRAGQCEHSGDLGAIEFDQLVRELYQEQLDSLAYLAEIKRRTDVGLILISRPQLTQLFSIALTYHQQSGGHNEIDARLLQQVDNVLRFYEAEDDKRETPKQLTTP